MRSMNWKNIIQDLIDAGMTQSAIGNAIGISQASVSDLLTGKAKSTYYEAGELLVKLHRKVMRRAIRKAA